MRSTAVEPLPLRLHRRAGRARRFHMVRAAWRFSVLAAGDAVVLLGIRYAAALPLTHAARGALASAVDLLRGPSPLQFLVSLLFGVAVLGNYGAGDLRRNGATLYLGTLLGLALLSWNDLWSHVLQHSVWVLAWAAVIGSAFVVSRLVIDRIVDLVRPVRAARSRALLIGGGERRAADTGTDPASILEPETYIVGSLNDAGTAAFGAPGLDSLGGIDDLPEVAAQHGIDTVVLCGYPAPGTLESTLQLADAAGLEVLWMLPRALASERRSRIVWRRGAPCVCLTRPGLRGRQQVVKRALDVAGAILLLVLSLPVLVVAALAVRLTSRGPVVFRQARIGAGGRRFRMCKFRTMTADAEARRESIQSRSIYPDPRLFKVLNDPRVTRVGRLLRRTSLDELPQLWNVLRGDMSLVGPRPPLPNEVALYAEHHYARFSVRPGLTGPWQVRGRSTLTDFEAVVRLEAEYIRGWNLAKDVEILLRTIPVVLRMNGAH